MNQPTDLDEVTEEIRTIYRSVPEQAPARIEEFLEQRLRNLSPSDRLALLHQLTDRFQSAAAPARRTDFESLLIPEFISLILGSEVSQKELESRELLDRFIRSLNTVFDSLNELIRVIHSTLLGSKIELQTIRGVIGSHLEAETETLSLEGHLNQVKEAFLVSHGAFKEAARAKFQEVLEELDPKAIEGASKSGLKIGPLRRAELFDEYQTRFQRIKKWFDSGRFSEELAREFEKVCQKTYADKGGRDDKLF